MDFEAPALSELQFEPISHVYTLKGEKLTSVSGVIERWKPKFDSTYWAARKAAELGVDVRVIEEEWERKRSYAASLGSRVHRYIELHLRGEPVSSPFDDDVNVEAWSRYKTWVERFGHLGTSVVRVNGRLAVELAVFHSKLKYAGTPDLVCMSNDGHAWVLDWKTNRQFSVNNRWGGTLLPPFNDLPACELSIYSLQTSLYRLALADHGIETAGAVLVWLGPGNELKTIKALDLRQRVSDAVEKEREA